MATIHGLLHRLRVLLSPESYSREVEKEIRFHLDLEAMHVRGSGLSAEDAAAAARKQFGNVTHTQEEVRRMSGLHRVDRLRQNLTYAVRGLRQSPGFTLAVVLTLGLGLGVNAAMFGFLDRVFVRQPTAVVEPHDVRRLYINNSRGDATGPNGRATFERFRYAEIRAIARVADTSIKLGMFTLGKDTAALAAGAQQVSVQRSLANAAFFRTLGVKFMAGRSFDAEEDRIDVRAPVAVISHDLWKRVFNRSSTAIGAVVRVADRPVTVIGVLAEGFSGIQLDRVDIWMPAGNYGNGAPQKTPWYETYANDFAVVTRIVDPTVERRFLALASGAHREVVIPQWATDSTALIQSGPVISAIGPVDAGQEVSISLRLGGVSFIVLLIALANVSNLLMVRASKRGREIAVRRALGASRARLFEQFLTESVLLAVVSLAVSVTLAFWVGSALRSVLLPKIAWASGPLDFRSAFIAIVATLVVGIVIGLAPALHVWRPDLIASLRAGSTEKAYRKSWVTAGLVVVQAALSVILLVGAGLFVSSLSKVHAIDVGYDVSRTMIVQPLTSNRVPLKSLGALMPDVLHRLASLPGVETVASASLGPMLGQTYGTFKLPNGKALPDIGGQDSPAHIDVSPNYFRAAGIRILSGRVFTASDKSGVVVSETMAKGYWPGMSPLGQCVILDDATRNCVSVIGVVADVNRFEIIEAKRTPQYYISTNEPHRVAVLRVAPERQSEVLAQMDAEIRSIVAEAGIVRTRSLALMLEPQFRPWRLGAILFSAMGLLALVVAAIGVYSVVAYVVSQRTNEMGIRVALGARATDITGLVVGDGLRTVAVGVTLGIALSLMLARFIESMLYGISARDPLVLGAAALVLGLIGLAASIIPALRAARVSPMQALRVD